MIDVHGGVANGRFESGRTEEDGSPAQKTNSYAYAHSGPPKKGTGGFAFGIGVTFLYRTTGTASRLYASS